MKKKQMLIIWCIISVTQFVLAQEVENKQSSQLSNLGYSGLIFTPSAYTVPWGEIAVGLSHFHEETAFTYDLGLTPDIGLRKERTLFLNIGFLPFAEFTVRLTKPYDSTDKNYGIGDRSISGRVQLIKEQRHLPAILIGANDLSSESSYFNTNYVVFSKSLSHKNLLLQGNIGYGFKFIDSKKHYLQGVFTGAKAYWKQIYLLCEYDAENINWGMGYNLKNHLSVQASFIKGRYLNGSINVHFNIK